MEKLKYADQPLGGFHSLKFLKSPHRKCIGFSINKRQNIREKTWEKPEKLNHLYNYPPLNQPAVARFLANESIQTSRLRSSWISLLSGLFSKSWRWTEHVGFRHPGDSQKKKRDFHLKMSLVQKKKVKTWNVSKCIQTLM